MVKSTLELEEKKEVREQRAERRTCRGAGIRSAEAQKREAQECEAWKRSVRGVSS